MTTARLGAVALAAGCGGGVNGPSGAEVRGRVTLDGQPLPGGLVVVGGDTGQASGSVAADGSYAVTNAPVGAVRVAVKTAHLRAAQAARRPPGSPAAATAPAVPAKYESLVTSGLTTTVGPGVTAFDIGLTAP